MKKVNIVTELEINGRDDEVFEMNDVLCEELFVDQERI